MLTTVDNPFNPFEEFDSWLEYDSRLGYNTPEMLDRIARPATEVPDEDIDYSIQQAIDEIVAENVSGMWRKVTRESAKTLLANR